MSCAAGGTRVESGGRAALVAEGRGGARGPGVSAERQRLGVHREDRAAVAEGEPGQDHLH